MAFTPHNRIEGDLASKNRWATPRWFAEALCLHFGLTVDLCAEDWSAVTPRHFTERDDAFAPASIAKLLPTDRVFMNPPYSPSSELVRWLRHAQALANAHVRCVVALIPANTDTSWFAHDVFSAASHLWFLEGRLDFTRPPDLPPNSPSSTVRSCIAIYERPSQRPHPSTPHNNVGVISVRSVSRVSGGELFLPMAQPLLCESHTYTIQPTTLEENDE